MKLSNKLAAVLCAAAVTASMFSGCSSGKENGSAAENPQSLSPSNQSSIQSLEAKPMVRVGTLAGPSGLGMVQLLEQAENKETGNIYDFTFAGAPDELSAKIISGELDIAAVPTNVAAALYQKTEQKVKIISTSTLGVLYLLHRPESVEEASSEEAEDEEDGGAEDGEEPTEASGEASESVEAEDESAEADGEEEPSEEPLEEAEPEPAYTTFADLSGETIYTTGQGATQEYVLRYLLTQAELDPNSDVSIEFKSEHAELASLMLEGRAPLALLPQPFVTTVTTKDETVETVFDLTEEWKKATGSELAMGAIVVRADFLEKNGAAVDRFLQEFAESVEYANSHVNEAAALAGKYEIINEDIARKAIPSCNIVCLTGEEMKTSVGKYLEILFDSEPKSVGGALPDDAFYYIPEETKE